MTKIKSITIVLFSVILLISCERDDFDKYERPEWLAGKLYTQILEQPELSTFARAVELTGYDEIINVSGSYTVFAPSNEAFSNFFSANSQYNSVEDMPVEELSRIVKYHIVQNPWSKSQLRSLDVYGWIDTLDVGNDEPRGFKRETLLLDENRKYGITGSTRGTGSTGGNLVIVDTTQSNWTRKVAKDSRKFAPIFFSEYFSIYELDSYDYEFYFNRPFEGDTNIYYANSKVVSREIFAENGFVYIVDEVVEPLDNAAQILEDEEDQYAYSDILEIINRFPEFNYNEERTEEQPGAEQGLVVDSLFDLSYPLLTFDINNEETSPPPGTFGLPQEVTIRYHHGLMVPTNSALAAFENEYFANPNGWGRIEGAPLHIQRIIANSLMSINPIYPTDFENGFYNGELDIVYLDEGDVIHKEFASNSTFIGLNEMVVPRAFSSILGPVYLRRGYSRVMYAVEQSGLKAALKRPNKNYSFYIESNANLQADSSLIYDSADEQFFLFQLTGGAVTSPAIYLSQADLRTLLLNHVATDVPKGIARKEFIPNLAGNYIVYDNETGIVSGTSATSVGYNGIELAPETPTVLAEADNGTTYDIDNWFSFSVASLYNRVSGYSEFHKLMRTAGFDRPNLFTYSFTSPTEFYTIFVPSDEAIQNSGIDFSAMSVEELRNFILLHFIQGEIIFTDGTKPAGYYPTLRKDEASTEFSTVYTQIYINPDIDVIGIKANDNSNYVEIHEGTTKTVNNKEIELTNLLVGVDISEDNPAFKNIYNNGVVHEIDRVLRVEDIDTK